jgi:endonuclease/exonuclease/phosphatase (EEP) superfamily protein YafD
MPRQGITQEQFTAAIEALEARGESISKISIRRELGNTGSYGTISAFLQTWRQNLPGQEPQPKVAAIPEPIQAQFGKIWTFALAAAQAELAPQREALGQEAASLRAVLAQAQAENDEAIHVLELQMGSLTAQLAEAIQRDQASQTRVAELSEALGYSRARLEALEAEYRNELARKDAVIADHEKHLADLTRHDTSASPAD